MLISLLMAFSLLAPQAAGSEQAVDVTVFFTYEDTHWTESQKIIDAVAQKYPQVTLHKVDVGTPEGYKALHAIEERLNVKDFGELTIMIGSGIVFSSKGEKREAESAFPGAIERMLGVAGVKGKRKADVAAYAKDIFGKDATIAADNSKPDLDTDYYRVSSGGKPVGWIANVFHGIECPICSDAQFLMALRSPESTVIDMRPVQALERRGTKLSDEESKKFVNQFKDRTPDDAGRKVDAISGATKTTIAYQISVANVLEEIKTREKK